MNDGAGLTVVELIMVVVIMGAISGFAIPNYVKSVETAHVREAEMHLRNIHAAQKLRRIHFGLYYPMDTSMYGVADINGALRLNLIENGLTYTCTGNGPLSDTYSCSADRDGGGYTLTVTQDPLSSSNPSCTGAECAALGY